MEQGFSNIGLLIVGTVITGLLISSANMVDQSMFSQSRSKVQLEAMEVERAINELVNCSETVKANSVPASFMCANPKYIRLKGIDGNGFQKDVAGLLNLNQSSKLYGSALFGSWAVRAVCDKDGLSLRAARLNQGKSAFIKDSVTQKAINFEHTIARINLNCADAATSAATGAGNNPNESTQTQVNVSSENLKVSVDKNNLSAISSNRLNQVSTRVYPLSGARIFDSSSLRDAGMTMANFKFTAKGNIADVEINLLIGGYEIDHVHYSVDMILASEGNSNKYHVFYSNPIV